MNPHANYSNILSQAQVDELLEEFGLALADGDYEAADRILDWLDMNR